MREGRRWLVLTLCSVEIGHLLPALLECGCRREAAELQLLLDDWLHVVRNAMDILQTPLLGPDGRPGPLEESITHIKGRLVERLTWKMNALD